jgi:hypothetical protein
LTEPFLKVASPNSALFETERLRVEDRRKHPRAELEEPAYISSSGASWSCTVVNLAPEGAAIDVADPSVLPDRFLLMMAKDRRMFKCRFAWAQHNRVGVSFEPDAAVAATTESPFKIEA